MILGELHKIYNQVEIELNELRQSGTNLDWKGIDLGDLLKSEMIIAKSISASKFNRSVFESLKLVFYGFWKRSKLISVIAKKHDVLAFFNEPNQWDVMNPVHNCLVSSGISIYILTSKEQIVKNISHSSSSVCLIFGFSFTARLKSKSNSFLIDVINFYLPKVKYLNSQFEKILQENQFKYVLVGNDSTFEGRLLVDIARKKGIPTGTIQHGSVNRINPIYKNSLVDHFFVYGHKTKSELGFLGKKNGEVIVAGWPLQDEFKQKLNLAKNDKKVNLLACDILVCLSGVGHSVSKELHTQIIDVLYRLQSELKLTVTVKLHSKDSIDNYSKLLQAEAIIYDNNRLKGLNLSLIDLIVCSKCVFTVASTAALEALLSGIPVITIDLTNSFGDVDYIQDGLTFHSRNYDELKAQYLLINSIEKDKVDKKMSLKLSTYFDGYFNEAYRPARKIANVIIASCAE